MVTLSGGSTQLVAQASGPAAITAIRVKLNLPPSPDDYDLLRSLALQIKWDGETNASVWAPLGDFFGTAPGGNLYSSLPLGHTADGWWYCYWYMPFATSARVELVNDGATQPQVTCQLTTAPLDRPIAELTRFHAKWHRDAFLPTDPARAIDWTILTTTGAGRYRRHDAPHLESPGRLVGRGRRQVLRGRREVPVFLRHRLGGLLRLRVVFAGAVSTRLP